MANDPPKPAPPISTQAVSYAEAALKGLHEEEVEDLALILDAAMREIVERYVERIRKG
jgi:hypothetical protein